MTHNANEPAYPKIATGDGNNYHEGAVYTISPGLTKRELFAAMAMQGLLANPAESHNGPSAIASDAACLADAMLAELEDRK